MNRTMRNPVTAVSAGFLVLVIAAVVFAPLLAPYPPLEQDLTNVLSGPSAEHLLGTDSLGRDVLSRLLFGGGSTMIGVVQAVAAFLVVGVPAGLLAGYSGGMLDTLIQRTAEIVFAVPAIVLILVVLAVFPNNTTAMMLTLGVLGAPALMRILRGNTKVIRGELSVQAARASGLSGPQIMLRHVLPRLIGPIIVQASLFAATAVLIQTGLGYLGIGVQIPDPSWGNMVSEASQAIDRQPWLLVPSGVLIGLVILAFGLLGDAARDAAAARWSASSGSRARRVVTPSPDAPDPGALLSVRGLTVSFPVQGRETTVVRDVHLDVLPGETVGIVGESGCGKTVTAMAVLGLLRGGGQVSAGSVWFEGRDLCTLSRADLAAVRGSGIGFISQEPIAGLDPAFTVGAQLIETIRLRGSSRTDARARAIELLSMVRLREPEAVARRYPHELSGGMAQRIGIALALAAEPRLLIADEPTTALDVTVQAEILDLLAGLSRETGMAVVLVTHDWGVLAAVCDRAVVMYAGEVVEQGSVDHLLDAPQHPYTRGLAESNPALTPPGQRLSAIPGSVPSPAEWPAGCHFQARCALATAACADQPIPVVTTAPGRESRCLLTGAH
ncbi:dipeptide/oligopeptide/nickel ABC transporter permease/ATP-binding protein [Amycolatopsis sp. NPDC059090]|uniref:dipeptide/oligopeptide/nickel ABC transporter permease/ATP-binding protein n=1 Tax=unclassified Amycolatopsis TaxID=2618356 RepID=UPI0036707570